MTEQAEQPARAAGDVHMTDLVLPSQTNNHGTMFGGDVMALMDKAAGIAALRFCRQLVVTASSERIDFQTPIYGGEIIEAISKVIFVGRTSMIVRVRIYAEPALTGEQRVCTTGYFSMVAIDKAGHPVPVPRLLFPDEQSEAEWTIGQEIRQMIDVRRRYNNG
jgi:acyl-CoA hydrolase